MEKVPTGSYPFGRRFKFNKWVSVTYGLGPFQTVDFIQGPGASVSVHQPFKNRVSISYSPMVVLEVSPIGFQCQVLWGFVSLVQLPGLGCLIWDTNLLLLSDKICVWDPFWIWVTISGVDFLTRPCLCFSYTSQCGVFIHCSRGAVQPAFRSFSEGIFPHVALDLLCLWEEVILGLFYTTTLTPLDLNSLKAIVNI